jgi:hypothetical protein
MSKHQYIYLGEEERVLLQELIHRGESEARVQTRARILLLSDRNQGRNRTLAEVADSVLCSMSTVRNVKRNHLSGGIEAALYEKPRPGVEPTFTGEVEAKLTMVACSKPPEGHAHWSLRLLAGRMVELGYVESISHVTVGTLLKKTNSNLGE